MWQGGGDGTPSTGLRELGRAEPKPTLVGARAPRVEVGVEGRQLGGPQPVAGQAGGGGSVLVA